MADKVGVLRIGDEVVQLVLVSGDIVKLGRTVVVPQIVPVLVMNSVIAWKIIAYTRLIP